MNSERQLAYLNLINQLLTCPTGEEAEILKSHPDLLDDGLVAAMLEEADNLREQGELDNANRLKNLAGLLGKVNGDFLAGIALKAEADRLLEQGNQQYEMGSFQESLQYWEEALTIYRTIGDRTGVATSLNNLGVAYDSLGQFHRAIELREQQLEIVRQIRDRQGEAISLGNLGSAYYSLKQYHKAIEFYEQYLIVSRAIGNRQLETAALGCLGSAYRYLGEYQRAIEFYEQYLMMSRVIANRRLESAALGCFGNTYRCLEHFEKAIEFYELSLVIKREIGDRKGESACLGCLGEYHYSLRKFDKAIEFYEMSLVIKPEIGDRQGEADSLGNLGNAYSRLRQFEKAVEFHELSLVILREIGNREREADCLKNSGEAYYSLRQFDKAIKFHELSLVILREIGDREKEADCLDDLGMAYYSLDQFYRAIEFHELSLEISREIGYRKGEAISLGSLGLAYQSLGKYHKAIELNEQSLVIKRETGNRLGEAASLGNLGLAYLSVGQYHKAIDFSEQSLKIELEIEDRAGESISLGCLGSAYYYLGEYNRARDFGIQSLKISIELEDWKRIADSAGNLGLAYYSLRQFDKAIEWHELSLKNQKKIGSRKGEAVSLYHLGLDYYYLGQLDKAIEFQEQSLEISQEIGYRRIESESLYIQGAVFSQKKQLPEAEVALRASVQIRETLRYELFNDDHKVSFFETQLSAYRLLQQVLVARSKFDEALEISEMSRTRAFVELLQQTLLTNDVPANDQTNRLSIPRIQQIAQQKNSTIIEYSIIDPDIYIWVIQPNGNITHRAANLEPLNQQNQSLKQIILKTRVSIGVDETDDEDKKIQVESKYWPDINDGYPLLKILHQILIEPIADLLPTDPNALIIFIPHYDLFLVPFTALQSANNRYLIEDHTIITAPSIQVLEQTSQHQQTIKKFKQTALVVGDPTIHPSHSQKNPTLRQISNIKEAAEAIAAILQTTAITGENATKAVVIDQMLNTRIVHLSTHGVFDHSQKSGIPGTIILAPSIAPEDDDDGALTAIDILQLKLNSELVVLSACSTGRGTITGDGVNGLSRCFILAGVPSIIVSLWNMGAPSAKLLMTEFYQNLARGDNRAAALRYAMLTTKKQFTRPKTWAAFTLIGETESISLETEQIDLRRFVMSLLNNTSKEIVIALTKLFKTAPPSIFAKDLPALSRSVKSTDDVNILAEKIKDWCEGIPFKRDLEDEIKECGPGGTDDDAPEEIEREFMETLEENMMRLYPSGPPVSVVETEDSGTEST